MYEFTKWIDKIVLQTKTMFSASDLLRFLQSKELIRRTLDKEGLWTAVVDKREKIIDNISFLSFFQKIKLKLA